MWRMLKKSFEGIQREKKEKKETTRNYKSFLRFVLNQSDQIFAHFKLEILGLLR